MTSIDLHHSRTNLRRGLDLEERVVYRDARGTLHLLEVTGLAFTEIDTVYTLTPVPRRLFEQREVLDLLTRLRCSLVVAC
ncbi:MAG: hypothetical protein F2667_09890 [Actinobacteria bacterium]|uniref:Unannotated protein n=1 Tax=freshwater metagenome TaxID=449393 RepID=A0A6J6RJQ9_9ZZZZ|nr:hypothetical protein [Actinomycetota bacterium]